MKCVMCAKETDSFTKNKVCKECDKIYFDEENSSDFQINKEKKLCSTDDSFNNSSFESGGNLMIKCPVCQTKNTEEALFCKKCGVNMSSAIEAARRIKMEELRAFLLCKSCGKENEKNSTYCIKCGSILATPEPNVNSPRNEVRATTIEGPHCQKSNQKPSQISQSNTGVRILGLITGIILIAIIVLEDLIFQGGAQWKVY